MVLIAIALSGHWFGRDGLRDNADGAVSFTDIVYFTAMTVTTVGFGDILPVSTGARMFDTFVVTPIRIFVFLIFLGTACSFMQRRRGGADRADGSPFGTARLRRGRHQGDRERGAGARRGSEHHRQPGQRRRPAARPMHRGAAHRERSVRAEEIGRGLREVSGGQVLRIYRSDRVLGSWDVDRLEDGDIVIEVVPAGYAS